MINLNLILISCVLLLISCSIQDTAKSKLDIYILEQEILVDIIPLTNSSIDFIYPTAICKTEDYLVIQDDKNNYFYYILSLPDYKFQGAFGTKDGPDGFINPVCFCQNDNNNLYIYDVSQIYIIDILQVIENQKVVSAHKKIKLPEIDIRYKDVYVAGNSILGNTMYGSNIYFNYNITEGILNNSYTSPIMDANYDPEIAGIIFQGLSDFDRQSELFYHAYILFDRIDVFSKSGEVVKSISVNGAHNMQAPFIEEGMPTMNNIQYYKGIEVGKNYFLAHYHNDIVENFSNNEYEELHLVDKINLKGKKIVVNANIMDFTFDDSDDRIFLIYDDGFNTSSIGYVKIQN